ncbi:hypothetical protein CsSME_00022833 [Camellia sinensis var. sinensis]
MKPNPTPFLFLLWDREMRKKKKKQNKTTNIRLKPRLCDCGRTAAMYIVCVNATTKFTFDEDDDDTSSIIHSNVGPRKTIRTEKLNDLQRRLCEMDNEIHEHGRRLQRI